MKIKSILLGTIAIALLASCNQYNKTKTGLPYKIISGGGKEKVHQGQFIKLNLEFTIPGYTDKNTGKDTVLRSTFNSLPMYIPVDTNKMGKYNFGEVITLCSAGDKAEFVMSIDTLKKMGMIPQYDKVFAKGRSIKGKVEILKAFNNPQDVQADYMKDIDKEKQKEITEIETYLKDKNIKAQKTANGVFVEINNAGTGAKADSGKNVSVIYKGYLLKTGKVFDSTAAGAAPINVTIGAHQVIPGWEDGLKLFTAGSKGKLYIPAMMAYGPQGQPPVIPEFSNLVFDVNVTSVTDAPPPVPQPTTPAPSQKH